jgi:predicted phage terminase large subunit-like protein
VIADPLAQQLAALPPDKLAYLQWQMRWAETARPQQIMPEGGWTECGVLAGRGFGKTRVGAEWLGQTSFDDPQALPACVVAPTQSDVRFTCFEGESGLLAVVPPECVANYNRSDLVLTLTNGATIRGFSAEKADRLRGPQHARAWCFVAGTQVAVPGGITRPIEALQPGDYVMTRKGPRAVVANSVRSAPVGEATFSSGQKLVGTTDHPVYTSHGWTDLGRLQIGDEVCAASALRGAVSSGTSTAIGITSGPTSPSGPSEPSTCTGSSGKPSTGLSLLGTTSTIGTATSSTTRSRTLSASRMASTNDTTSGSNPSPRPTGQASQTSSRLASIAAALRRASASFLRRSAEPASTSAPTSNAKPTSSATIAGNLSAHGWELSAASVASTWRPTGQQSVYCLKVDGEPEYFANGVLVHNCDELAAWGKDAEDTWDMLMFGMRLGPKPQVLWTTTPKPVQIVRRLTAPQDERIIVRGSTFDNKANLPASFFKALEAYEGTKIGRQELYGELIDPEEAGIIKRSWFRLWPASTPLPRFDWIIMSLDTAYTEAAIDKKGDPDPTACSVWGVFHHEKRPNAMLLDCWDEHLGLPDLIRRVRKEMNTAYGEDADQALIKPMFGNSKPSTSGRKPDILLIEDKGSGISLRQMLYDVGLEAYAYNPGRADKVSRLHVVSPVFAQKRVWLPESRKLPGKPMTWCEPLIAQLCAFSGEGSIKHDDHVDACTQALRLMLDKGLIDLVTRKVDNTPAIGHKRQNPYAA